MTILGWAVGNEQSAHWRVELTHCSSYTSSLYLTARGESLSLLTSSRGWGRYTMWACLIWACLKERKGGPHSIRLGAFKQLSFMLSLYSGTCASTSILLLHKTCLWLALGYTYLVFHSNSWPHVRVWKNHSELVCLEGKKNHMKAQTPHGVYAIGEKNYLFPLPKIHLSFGHLSSFCGPD